MNELQSNCYPTEFIKRQFYRSTFIPPSNSQSHKSYCTLPYSYGIERISRALKKYNIKTIYQTPSNLKTLLRHPDTKHNTNNSQKSNLIYRIPCRSCPATYIGETGKTLEERTNQHRTALQNYSPLSLLVDHALKQDHIPNFDSTEIVYQNIKDKHSRLFLESWTSIEDKNSDKRAKRIWYDIKKRFEGSLENKRIDLMLDLARLKLNPNENVNMYIVRAQKLAQEITQLGKTVTERELVRYIVEGLTPNFDTITAALSINRGISLPDLRQTLLDFEKKKTGQKQKS
ncbi:hypothetical protein LAZ67_11002211 [Cordylochernes scorpioides]|uniref:GIY-YIG homing endonuclease n=1 Tax=Cordylochernes scorpioides TaxID=51811 RepID=A0ABY6L1T4_9ARAC|nr:hypothetical protein LAZ67_11002211 [Cordylochernes scorpioides]